VGVANGLFGSLVGVLMIERIPEQMRGRIMGSQNAIMTAAPSVGIGAAAVLTEFGSVNVAAIALPLVWVLALAAFAGTLLRNLESGKVEPEEGPVQPREETVVGDA
jgi:MFS family permease